MKKEAMTILLTVVVATLTATLTFAEQCDGPGTGTPGYWKNHPEAWPVEAISIGSNIYTKAEAIEWLGAPVKNDKSITLFKAYVAAHLNLLIGNCGECILEPPDPQDPGYPTPWFNQAHWWLVVRPVGSKVRANTEPWQRSHGELVYWWLDAYNNGLLCAPSRD